MNLKNLIALNATIAMTVMVLSANAQNSMVKLPYNPVRSVGNKVYSLQPIYDWIKLLATFDRPMQEWIGVSNHRGYLLNYRVEQVLPEGLILSSSGEWTVGEGPRYGSSEPILLKNYPGADSLVDGQEINFLAIRVENFKYTATDGALHTIAAYDCGIPYVPPPPSPEEIAAAKAKQEQTAKVAAAREYQAQANAVRWLQPQATNGDASAQCSLGLHYLNGQGCKTNREQGIYWLKMAAAQGDSEASNVLVRLQR